MQDEQLIDRIYEAGMVPDLWPDVLATLTQRYDGVGTVLFASGPGPFRWTSSPSFAETVEAFVREGWLARNVRPARALARGLTGFITERDIFEPDELLSDPLFAAFMQPRGIGSELGTLIPVPTGDMLVLSINRPFALGAASPEAVAAANRLRPHLARAALFSARLGLERASAASEALARIGLPAAVLSDTGRLLVANGYFETMMPDLVVETAGRVALVDRIANAMLTDAIAGIGQGRDESRVCSIPMRRQEGWPPVIAHVLPIRRSAHDLFLRATSILMLTPVAAGKTPAAGLLEGLFDLTPAEARTARAVGDGGRSLAQIAGALNLSHETLRSQLRSVFEKTGTTRQPELVKLLAGLQAIDS